MTTEAPKPGERWRNKAGREVQIVTAPADTYQFQDTSERVYYWQPWLDAIDWSYPENFCQRWGRVS